MPLAGAIYIYMVRKILILVVIVVVSILSVNPADPAGKRGALVLCFDDGDKSWTETIAGELARVGGKATAFVNNYRIHSGLITVRELTALQDRFHWEIGTHGYHHFDPKPYVELYGPSQYVDKEIRASIDELRSYGIAIQSLALPFNSITEDVNRKACEYVKYTRRDDDNPLALIGNNDNSFPGVIIDIGHYVPLSQMLAWIDTAHGKAQLLFLVSHQVLQDNKFVTGEVLSVTERTLMAKEAISRTEVSYMCLVPDTAKALEFGIEIKSIEGNVVRVGNGDLTRLSKSGAKFLIGPCMSIRLSDFRELIKYAAERVDFLTVTEAMGQQRSDFRTNHSKKNIWDAEKSHKRR